MQWTKLGKIFQVDKNNDWMYHYSAVPFVELLNNDNIKIYFTTRNKNNESAIGYIIVNIYEPNHILEISKKPILSKGQLGTFDDSGAMGCSLLIVNKNTKYLYYQGWNLGVTVPYRNSIGIAISKDNSNFYKFSEGPILDRTYNEPHFVATPNVLLDNNIYKMWYLSCTEWIEKNKNITHKYHIKYAESHNGIDWDRKGIVAIDYKDKYEYAISVPRVIIENGKYKMWFSSRGTKDIPTYRIRYAESSDGINWTRKDDEVGIDVSKDGWDSEMICYPFVFDHKGKRYMLYNGDDYGKTGFGLAVLEDNK